MVKSVDNYLHVKLSITPMTTIITSRTSTPLFLTFICKQTSSVTKTSLLIILDYTTKYISKESHINIKTHSSYTDVYEK